MIGCATGLAVVALWRTRRDGAHLRGAIAAVLDAAGAVADHVARGSAASPAARDARRHLQTALFALLDARDAATGGAWPATGAVSALLAAVDASGRIGYRVLAMGWLPEVASAPSAMNADKNSAASPAVSPAVSPVASPPAPGAVPAGFPSARALAKLGELARAVGANRAGTGTARPIDAAAGAPDTTTLMAIPDDAFDADLRVIAHALAGTTSSAARTKHASEMRQAVAI